MSVGSFAPDGYEAYVRIDHAEVEGRLPADVERRLREHLSTYTSTPDRLLCAAWNNNVWWPEDRAWCVVTEVGSRQTFVACSSACARVLLDDESLDTSPAMLLHGNGDPSRHGPNASPHVYSTAVPWRPHPPDDETASASWYVEGLTPWPEPDGSVRVRSFVPAGYEAYVRIDHPELEGQMPLEVAWGLREYLPYYTKTPDKVFYAAWDGSPPARDLAVSMSRLIGQKRNYIVFVGDRGGPFVEFPAGFPEWVTSSPLIVNAWWPEDRAWCVVTEIDSRETFVACSNACAQALLDDEFLEAVPATLLDRLDDAGRNAGS